ncbi:antitoxin Xre-like helix-turn-helix domain-containing protein [Pseudomonas sp. SC11]|uniref:antitoxin Xre-like helix-turn-helix domain-containing protein n=1 Tax=Pseudomonas sp. SC11 TaxID=326927 RepID=UPI00399BF722
MNSIRALTQEQSSTGLKVALRIINAWQATPAQACSILRISSSTYRRAVKGLAAGRRLDLDQQQRIGLVLGIHASLRVVFTNQANVLGFPALKNDNPFFEGRSPVEVMAQGDLISIYETFKRIQRLEWLAQP